SLRGLFASLLTAMTIASTNVLGGQFVEKCRRGKGGAGAARWLPGATIGSGAIFGRRAPARMRWLPQFNAFLGGPAGALRSCRLGNRKLRPRGMNEHCGGGFTGQPADAT